MPEAKLEPAPRSCLYCGEVLTLTNRQIRRGVKYCSRLHAIHHRHELNPEHMKLMGQKGLLSDRRRTQEKVCSECNTMFLPVSSTQKWCKVCVPDKIASSRMLKYKVSETKLTQYLEQQGGGCAMCGLPLTRKTARVDHDHGCCDSVNTCGECIRGLLCHGCNIGLHFMERKGWLEKANAYLNMKARS